MAEKKCACEDPEWPGSHSQGVCLLNVDGRQIWCRKLETKDSQGEPSVDAAIRASETRGGDA